MTDKFWLEQVSLNTFGPHRNLVGYGRLSPVWWLREFWMIVSSDSLHKAVSALYAKILIILGLALPMSEAIAEQIHPGRFEAFYLYLFLLSLLFLLFLYVDLLQTR